MCGTSGVLLHGFFPTRRLSLSDRACRSFRSRTLLLKMQLLLIALIIREGESMPQHFLQTASNQTDDFVFHDTGNSSINLTDGRVTIEGETRSIWNESNEDKIYFPDDKSLRELHTRFRPEPAAECLNKTFCERTLYYPKDYIAQTLRKQNAVNFLVRSIDEMEDDSIVKQRFDFDDDTPLCTSVPQVIFPKTAQNKNKEWLFIVNQEEYQQGIRVETCHQDGSECRIISRFAEGYKTICKQKFVFRQLAALGRDGTVINDSFRLPSSCCCHVQFTNTASRLAGVLRANAQSPIPQS